MAILRATLILLALTLFLAIACLAGCLGSAGSRLARGSSPLFCRALLWLLGVRLIACGTAAARPARLLVANHVSWIDVLALGSVEPLCFLAKREVATWPVIARLARPQGTVFVDRARRRRIPVANAAMAERLRAGHSVALFPEGTTHDGTQRGRFLTSHLACLRDRLAHEPDLEGCPVQAVGGSYSDPTAAWVGDASLVPHLWAVLNRPGMTCVLAYGRIVTVVRGYDRKALGRQLRDEVETLVRVRPARHPATGPAHSGAPGLVSPWRHPEPW